MGPVHFKAVEVLEEVDHGDHGVREIGDEADEVAAVLPGSAHAANSSERDTTLASGEEVTYAGLAGVGTYASTDGGATWEARSEEFGGAFMGRIQVDPADDDHILAPDMSSGAVVSTDGGRTWKALGGVQGAMWVSWDQKDTDRIIVSAQGSAAESLDGGQTWDALQIPQGASIVEFSPDDTNVLYSAVLEAPEASVYVSSDGGDTWTRP